MIARDTDGTDRCDLCKKRIDDGEEVERTHDAEFVHMRCFQLSLFLSSRSALHSPQR